MTYIIKNCPAFKNEVIKTYLTLGVKQFKNVCSAERKETNCKDITDCLLKRIVEMCDSNTTKVLHEGETFKLIEGNRLGSKILELLEIEEVDE